MNTKRINIAIDGHSSCGKGTLARYLAKQLGYKFIDSGAMYRAVTLFALQNDVPVTDEEAITALMNEVQIDFLVNEETGRSDVFLNGKNVEKLIRNMEVAAVVSEVAKIPVVRVALVAQQRQMGKEKGVVMDGRDIGTVVFPDAELKIFMTATAEVRARRRFDELTQSGVATTYEEVLNNVLKRDSIDSTRSDGPLTFTSDYKLLDNSHLTIQQQNELAMSWVNEVLHS